MSNTTNIMIVGVGGQGTLLASRILGSVALSRGLDVKVSEVHGMSQRGGSVVTYVKYGQAVHSPIIDRGEADIILAFEMLEAYRALPYLKKDGKMIVNNQKINPMPVITGATTYPEDIDKKLSEKVDLAFTFISDIENGKKWVSPETIEKLSKFLDVEVYQFFLPEDYVFQEDKSIESFANEINESIRKIELRYLGK